MGAGRSILVLLGVAGCVAPTEPVPGIQIGEEGDEEPCRVVTTEVSDPSVASGTLGFSADTFLEGLDTVRWGTFIGADGREVPVSVRHEPVGPVRWVWREPLYDKAPDGMCDLQLYEVDLDWEIDAGEVAVWTTSRAWAWSADETFAGVRVRASAIEARAPQALSSGEVVVAFGERGTTDGWTGTATWEQFEGHQLVGVEPLGTWVTGR